MTIFRFDAKVAYSPTTDAFLQGIVGSFYLDTDTALTTPLTVTPVGATATTTVTSLASGLIPDFDLDQGAPNNLTGNAGSRLVWASGAHRVTLTSMPYVTSELTIIRDFMESNGIRYVRYVAGAWESVPPVPQSWVKVTYWDSTQDPVAASPDTGLLITGDKWFQHKDAA